MKSIYRLTVRGYELDSFGHVNNAVYLQYAEAAKWDFFHSRNLLPQITEAGLFPVILESNLRYMHELRLMDSARIETEWSYVGGVVQFKHMIYNETSGQRACKITGKLVFLSQAEHIICDIPDDIRAILERETDEME